MLVIGIIIGLFLGVALSSLCVARGRADDEMLRITKEASYDTDKSDNSENLS